MNENEPLDRLGQFLMVNLRDRAIDHHDLLAKGLWKAPSLQKLQEDLHGFTLEQQSVVRRCVIQAIDTAVHDFLFALQELADFKDDIQLFVMGQNVAKMSDGLHGEPYSENGWMAKYSAYGQHPPDA